MPRQLIKNIFQPVRQLGDTGNAEHPGGAFHGMRQPLRFADRRRRLTRFKQSLQVRGQRAGQYRQFGQGGVFQFRADIARHRQRQQRRLGDQPGLAGLPKIHA